MRSKWSREGLPPLSHYVTAPLGQGRSLGCAARVAISKGYQNGKLLHHKRSPGLSLFRELLHRKRSHGLSLFSKREYGEAGREFVQRRSLSTAKPGGSYL